MPFYLINSEETHYTNYSSKSAPPIFKFPSVILGLINLSSIEYNETFNFPPPKSKISTTWSFFINF